MHAQKARKNGSASRLNWRKNDSASRLNWRKNSTGCDAALLLISYLSIFSNTA